MAIFAVGVGSLGGLYRHPFGSLRLVGERTGGRPTLREAELSVCGMNRNSQNPNDESRNPKEYRNPNDEIADFTREGRSTFVIQQLMRGRYMVSKHGITVVEPFHDYE